MAAVVNLFENECVTSYIQSQFKKLKKKKDKINCEQLITKLNESIKDKYTINKISTNELTIKVDKKKIMEDVKADISNELSELIGPDIDVNFLFKFIKNNNELIVRLKRKIE